jgi:hypothetical protein
MLMVNTEKNNIEKILLLTNNENCSRNLIISQKAPARKYKILMLNRILQQETLNKKYTNKTI